MYLPTIEYLKLFSPKDNIVASKTLLRKDYILVLLMSLICFLTIKSVFPGFVYLVIAVLVGIYFFPVKLYMGNELLNASNRKRVALILSYFVISNIIILTALTVYLDGEGFIHNTILIYSIINLVFLLYFHFMENMRYNVILSLCTMVLISAVMSAQY